MLIVLASFTSLWFFLTWWIALIISVLGIPFFALRIGIHDVRRIIRNHFRDSRDVGSAKKLVSTVFYLMVMVRQSTRHIARVGRAQNQLDRALRFLESRAKEYGKQLEFISMSDEPVDVVMEQASADECRLDGRFLDKLRTKMSSEVMQSCDASNLNRFFIVFTNKGEPYRACAIREHQNSPPNNHPEFCVCPDDSNATTIAHEILHLFGAQDLYEEGTENSKERDRFLRNLRGFLELDYGEGNLDSSIMFKPSRGIEENTIDQATAYSVGWSDTIFKR
jgi:hypothetical protein